MTAPCHMKRAAFQKALTELINQHGMDTWCDTPDFLVADHMFGAMGDLRETVMARDTWLSRPTAGEQINSTGWRAKP